MIVPTQNLNKAEEGKENAFQIYNTSPERDGEVVKRVIPFFFYLW